MWFDQKDDTFPTTMDGHTGIVAINSSLVVVAGAIWAESGNQLFLHQLVADDYGKRYHDKYHALDIGVSYNPKRYEFFKNFEVETYPIILKKPFYVPVIRFSPF